MFSLTSFVHLKNCFNKIKNNTEMHEIQIRMLFFLINFLSHIVIKKEKTAKARAREQGLVKRQTPK